MKDWRERIRVDTAVCHGKPCIAGTRVLVAVLLASLAEGCSREEILRSFPSITNEDIDAVLAYAAELAQERVVELPLEVAS